MQGRKPIDDVIKKQICEAFNAKMSNRKGSKNDVYRIIGDRYGVSVNLVIRIIKEAENARN